MQALIVDDDAPTVACIQASIDWENLGIQNVYAAYNRNGATHILNKEKIDIIICDIEMPMGSGLDLLAWIRKKNLSCEFIFLTCHDRFDFAAAAIEYKAASYLLKPFDPEKMTTELIKATERIEQSQQLHEYSRYGSFWMENRDDVEREFWRELLTAKMAAQRDAILAAAERRGMAIEIDKTLTLVLFSLQYDANTDNLRTGSAQGVWEHRATKLFARELLKSNGMARILTEWRGDRLWLICVLFEKESAFSESERMIDVCKTELHADVSGYFAEGVAFEQTPAALSALKEADADNVDRSCIIQRRQPQKKVALKNITLDLAPFHMRLAVGNKAKILNYLYAQLESLAAEQPLTPKILYTVQQDILQETYAYLHGHGIRLDLLFTDDSYYSLTAKASTSMYNMMKWLSLFINHVIDAEQELKRKATVVKQAQLFIDQHFCEDISRNEAANAVFLTPEYLAKIFKRETGVSVNGYINAKRIELAKELLASSDLAVSDIAIRTGFSSSSYFVAIFRKTLGCTPLDYRRELSVNDKDTP